LSSARLHFLSLADGSPTKDLFRKTRYFLAADMIDLLEIFNILFKLTCATETNKTGSRLTSIYPYLLKRFHDPSKEQENII